MNYQAFTNDALSMMHYSIRGALAVDDELTRLGTECRFRVRENADWRKHADGLEAEMSQRGMTFVPIDWLEIEAVAGSPDAAALQPDIAGSGGGPAPVGPASEGADGADSRLKKRIAAFIKSP
jgi:hypothetical protein